VNCDGPSTAAVGDVVGELPLLRIEIGKMADPLGNFMIGARGIGI
jgi:hypothetical protein